MRLQEFPRPPQDNGRGIHWSTSQYQWGKKDWELWSKRLLDMKIKWVTCIVPPDHNANELTKRLIDLEIMPIVRFMGGLEPKVVGGAILDKIYELTQIGVSYFQLKNENDASVERERGLKQDGWEETDARNIITEIARVRAAGGIYVLYAYNSGPKEPRQFPEIIVDLGGKELLNTTALCIHNYGKGRPPEYPNDPVRMFGRPLSIGEMYKDQGQPDDWDVQQVQSWIWKGQNLLTLNPKRDRQKDPNITILTDFTSFRMFDYWAYQYKQQGLDMPLIIGGESGWEINDAIDDFYPNPTDAVHSEYTKRAVEFMQGSKPLVLLDENGKPYDFHVPEYVAAMTYWNMGEAQFGSDTSGQWETGAWYTSLHDELFDLNGNISAVDVMVQTPTNERHPGNVPLVWNVRKHLFPPDYVKYWDSRLIYVGAQVNQHTSLPVYAVSRGEWQDSTDEGIYPRGYIMVLVRDEFGVPIRGAQVEIERYNGIGLVVDTIETKGEADGYKGNYQMTGTKPVYTMRVSTGKTAEFSDSISGLGLGRESGGEWDGTSYYFEFRLCRGT